MFTASMSRRKLVLVIEPVEDLCFTGPRDRGDILQYQVNQSF